MINVLVSHSRIVPFMALHADSPQFDIGARERISCSVKRHQGNINVLVHPGFFTVDTEGKGNIYSAQWQKEVEDPHSGYNTYRSRVKNALNASELPLFIFHDRNKSPELYGWVLGSARTSDVVIVETGDSKSLPYLGKDEGPGDLDWDLFRLDLLDMGVERSRVFGEYLHRDLGLFSGCVNTAYQSLDHGLMKADLKETLTFPYGIYHGCSER